MVKENVAESDEVLKAEAWKIQLLFDRGLVNVGKGTETLQTDGTKSSSHPRTTVSVPLYTHAIAAGPAVDSSCPIEEGDILIVDRAVEPRNKNIVIASINGEQTVRRLPIDGKNIKLMPENSRHKPIEVKKDMDFRTQEVVIRVIRRTG